MIADMASPSRGALSSLASRSKRSSINWRSCGVMAFSIASKYFEARGRCRAGFVSQVVGARIKFLYATKRPDQLPVFRAISGQCNIVQRQQRRQLRTAEERMFMFALGGQGIEADKRVVDESGMAHHEPAIGQTVEE